MVPENKLGLLLVRVSRAHYNLASRVFEGLGLHRGQPPVLFELGCKDGMTQSELAHNLEVTPATITNMLHRMEQAGFITRTRDQDDSRISRVFLTTSGKIILDQVKVLADKMDQTTFAGFSNEEQNQVGDFLDRIRQNLLS
jgi:MarR family transcriptional regulator, organic hydroperoxide resistance regulator